MRSLVFILSLWLAIAPALADGVAVPGVPHAGQIGAEFSYPPVSGGGGCSQATALLARMDGSENTSAVTTAVCGMVTDGTFAALDGLQVYAINSTANALLNWIQNNYNGTVHGTLTFTANTKYTGDASTGYISTGFTPSTAGGNMAVDNASIGSCNLSSTITYGYTDIGAYNTGGNSYSTIGDSSGTRIYTLNDQNFASYTTSSPLGAWTSSRTSSTSLSLYLNGNTTPVATSATASGSLPVNNVITVFAQGAATPTGFSGDGLAYIFWGKGLTATQVNQIYSRLHTYLQAVGETAGC
ncbi:MAG: hypothetical protein KGI37_11065 [Alphaproteobacteria bacterium]|nr:hypothetical protein [Alphaproteobacteria bacterium]